MEYSGDLQNMGGEAYVKSPVEVFDDRTGSAHTPIENYVYPQKATAIVHFGRDMVDVAGYPSTASRALAHHTALTKAMVDHMRDVLPKPIIHLGERQARYGKMGGREVYAEYTTVSGEGVKVAISSGDGVIEVPAEIASISVPSWRRITYPNDDYYDMGPQAEVIKGPGVYFSPVEAFLGSAHDQFAGKHITPGYISVDNDSNPSKGTSDAEYEHVNPVECPLCEMNLVILDARLASVKVVQQELLQDFVVLSPTGKVHKMRIKFHLIYEFFWVCEQCDAELFGWDPCPEVIWT
jgi:hypothetical protein